MTSPSPAEKPVAHGFRWELVWLLWGAFFLNQADRQVFNVVLPLIREDQGLSDQELGLIATAFTAAYGLLVPIAGICGDLLDRRKIVFASLLVFSVGTLTTGLVSGFLLLLLFRGFTTGAGEAFYAPAAGSLIASAHSETRARALSLHQTANYTGVVLGGLIAGFVGQTYGWRAAFLLYGVMGLIWSVVFLVRTRGKVVSKPNPAARTPAQILGLFKEALALIARTPALIGQMVAFGGLVFVIVGFLTWSPTLLYERFDLSLVDAGFSSVFYHHVAAYVGVLAASWATDRFIRRFPRVRLLSMSIGLIGSAPFLVWAAQAGTLFQTYLALAGFGLFRGMYDAGVFAAVFDLVEDRLRSTVLGIVLASGFLVGAMSPAIMGSMKAEYGLEGGLMVLAGAAVAAGLVLLALTASRQVVYTE